MSAASISNAGPNIAGKKEKSVKEKEMILFRYFQRKIRRNTLSKDDPNYDCVMQFAEGLGQMALMGAVMVQARKRAGDLIAMVDGETASLRDFFEMQPIDGPTALALISLSNEKIIERAKRLMNDSASALGKSGAAARHRTDNEKREGIRAIWATGKYATRVLCAEEEHEHFGMALGTAVKALNKTPAPNPWPGKVQKGR